MIYNNFPKKLKIRQHELCYKSGVLHISLTHLPLKPQSFTITWKLVVFPSLIRSYCIPSQLKTTVCIPHSTRKTSHLPFQLVVAHSQLFPTQLRGHLFTDLLSSQRSFDQLIYISYGSFIMQIGCRHLDKTGSTVMEWVSYQLYHDENNIHCTFQWDNNYVNMSVDSRQPVLLLLLNTAWLTAKQQLLIW